MNDRELMQQALEALELYQSKMSVQMFDDTAKALRERLARQEQEPVAWVLHRELFWPSEYEVISQAGDNAIPLYTAPQPAQEPEQEPLTDEEIADLWGVQIFHVTDLKLAIDFVRDIERAHGIGEMK